MIPRGTGVDFVRTFGIPSKLEDAVEIALRGETRAIDAGRVGYRAWSGEPGEAWFFNVAGVGMSGAVAKRTNESSKALGGKVSYLWSTLAVFARWQNTEVRVTVDGEERSGLMHEVIVANGRYLGGGMLMTPEASPDDGLFDVLLLGDLTKADLVQDDAEGLPGHAPPPPEGRAPARRGRLGRLRRARCRCSSTASSRGRRRCGSSSSPRRCA